MKIKITSPGKPYPLFSADIAGDVTLSEVFNGIGILTEDKHLFGIAQRDTGLEIVCPDGAMVEIKINEQGKPFVVAHGVKDMGPVCNHPIIEVTEKGDHWCPSCHWSDDDDMETS